MGSQPTGHLHGLLQPATRQPPAGQPQAPPPGPDLGGVGPGVDIAEIVGDGMDEDPDLAGSQARTLATARREEPLELAPREPVEETTFDVVLHWCRTMRGWAIARHHATEAWLLDGAEVTREDLLRLANEERRAMSLPPFAVLP